MDLSTIYTEIITEHNLSNHNKHHLQKPNIVEKGHNPSCGDEIELELKFKDDIIEDAAFIGTGCAISQASTSIMIDLIKGRKKDEAVKLINTFLGMIKREIKDEAELEKLEDAIAFRNIANMPARVKCAVLAWHTLQEGIKKENKD